MSTKVGEKYAHIFFDASCTRPPGLTLSETVAGKDLYHRTVVRATSRSYW